MEKKMILVGIPLKSAAFNFMNIVIRELGHRSVRIEHIDLCTLQFETQHTKVWFIYDQWAKYWLGGVRADAIFGENWRQTIARAKPDAVIAWRDNIGLVDYICKVEAEALLQLSPKRKYCNWSTLSSLLQKAIEYLKGAIYGQFGIKDIMTNAMRPYPVNGYVDTDTVCERRVTDTWIGEMWPKTYITTAGSDTSEFYKRLINSVYGAFPENRSPFVALDTDTAPEVKFLLKGRGNGKTQACIEYMKKLIERGEFSMDAANAYIRNDIHMTRGAAMLASVMTEINDRKKRNKFPGIKNVHFSGPVTAVIWEDGTKTIVRCQGDNVQDPEKGLAMAIAKKAMGTNKSGSNYYDIFKKWLPKEEEPVVKYEEDNGVVLTPMEEEYDG